MSPKKNKTTKPALKKAGTMAATASAGKEYLKRSWGTAKLKRINPYITKSDETPASSSSSTPAPAVKPSLTKTRTMQTTTKEAKELLGQEVLADTRAETKRRQAAANSKKNAEKPARKPTLKRLGTMAKTANEGKAYVKRTGKKGAGRKRVARN